MKKRLLPLIMILILTFGVLAGCGGNDEGSGSETGEADYSGQTITVCAWGGSYAETLEKYIIPEFEEKTGANVEILLGSAPLAKLKAEGANASVDVLHMDMAEVSTGIDLGVLEKIDYDSLSNAKDLYTKATENEYAVITNWGTYGVAYRKDLVKTPPTSWADLWSTDYQGGKIGLGDVDFGGAVELADMAARTFGDSVITDQGSWDTVFGKLGELKPNVGIIASDHASVESMLTNGDLEAGIETNGRAYKLMTENENIAWADLKEGLPAMTTLAAVSSGSKNKELAMLFLDELIGPTAQEAYATNNYYAPSNKTAEIPEDLQSVMPYGEEAVNKLVTVDYTVFSPLKADFTERWNKTLK